MPLNEFRDGGDGARFGVESDESNAGLQCRRRMQGDLYSRGRMIVLSGNGISWRVQIFRR